MKLEEKLEYSIVSSYLCQLFLAINYLHSQHILHGFINSHEIYVNNSELKLSGLYFCEKLENATSETKLERPIFHKCPEEKITLKYDIWCLGQVLFEMTNANKTDKNEIRPAGEFRSLKKVLRKYFNKIEFFFLLFKNIFEKVYLMRIQI